MASRERLAAQGLHRASRSTAQATISRTSSKAARAVATLGHNTARLAGQATSAANALIARAIAAAASVLSSTPVTVAVVCTISVVAAVASILSLIPGFGEAIEQEERAACAVGGNALAVVTNLPKGSVAGYSGEQLKNAAQIMKAAQDLGLSARDQQIGIMTAMGESDLIVLGHGDAVGPDSRGLFQQRANGAWGTEADRMNPYTSAKNFFTQLAKITNRESMEPTMVAHEVQANADPYHYAPRWNAAGAVLQALAKTTVSMDAPTVSKYNTQGMKPQTSSIANSFGQQFGLKTVGGWRPFDPANHDDPKYGHSTGLAIDFMIDDVADGSAVGDKLASQLQSQASQLGVEYIIWQQRIWSPKRAGEGWRVMGDRGSPTANHMDHVHLSLNGGGGTAVGVGGGGECATAGQVSPGGWAKPGEGQVTSRYGTRFHPVLHVLKTHTGTDFSGGCDAGIFAAHDGTVKQAGAAGPAYGNSIEIDHGGGITSFYGHMTSGGVLVSAGDQVKAGQLIARQGSAGYSTGCHLHFEIHQDGQIVDPTPYLAKAGVK
ncbi:M23 family metallopeptidase [Luteococcus sp. H138]|uniref:M23 family metallopeptidase n=1 Tax=unclassified Luteococcus TaxID=2639923 RepID=UPI00313C896C